MTVVSRQEFFEHLEIRLKDNSFCTDMEPLLRSDLSYDMQSAGGHVREKLIALLAA